MVAWNTTTLERMPPTQTEGDCPLTLRVLVVEKQSTESMRPMLDGAGMQAAWASTGAEALDQVRHFNPHIVLVDLELPDSNGVSLVQWLAANTGCGLILVAGPADETEGIIGLHAGADDFIARPISPRALVARIRALHRRIFRLAGPEPPTIVPIGRLSVDLPRRRVSGADGGEIRLTGAEFAVLHTLITAHGRVVSRDQLCEIALRRPWRAEDRAIDQLIAGLRQKLAAGGEPGTIIQSVRGAGYLVAR